MACLRDILCYLKEMPRKEDDLLRKVSYCAVARLTRGGSPGRELIMYNACLEAL